MAGTATIGARGGGSPVAFSGIGGRGGSPKINIGSGSKEGGSVGGHMATFSSRVLGEAPRPTLSFGKPEVSPRMQKVAIGAEKAGGEVFRGRGLGEKIFVPQSRNRTALPETSTPIRTRSRSPILDLPQEAVKARFDDIVQGFNEPAQPPRETVDKIGGIDVNLAPKTKTPELRPALPEIALPRRKPNIEAIREQLQRIGTQTRQAPRQGFEFTAPQPSEPLQVQGSLPVGKPEGIVQRSLRTKDAAGYREALRRRSGLKTQEEEVEKPKQSVQSVKRKVMQGLRGLVVGKPLEAQAEPQAQPATVAKEAEGLKLFVRRQGLADPEAVVQLSPLVQAIESAESKAQAAVQVRTPLKKVEDKPDPEKPQDDDKPGVEAPLYSVDEAANNARLGQVIDRENELAYQEAPDAEITGTEFVGGMEGKKKETTSGMVSDDKKGGVEGVDGSDEEWRFRLSKVVRVHWSKFAQIAKNIIMRVTAVKRGPGKGVTEEDKALVSRVNIKTSLGKLLPSMPSL